MANRQSADETALAIASPSMLIYKIVKSTVIGFTNFSLNLL